jgi:hypothetical protein
MAATITATFQTTDQGEIIVTGTIALTGNYGGAASHGDTLDLTQAFGKLLLPVSSVSSLLFAEVLEMPTSGSVGTGYEFYVCPGTTLKNGVLNIVNPTSQAEYTQASAYSAPLLAAKLRIRAYFKAL